MVHWKLKGCPRCHGDVYVDQDLDGWYEQCLQCAHWRELPGGTRLERPAANRPERPAVTEPERRPVGVGAEDPSV